MPKLGKSITKKNNLKKRILILSANSDIGIEVTKIFLQKNWHVTGHYNSNNINTKKLNILKKQNCSLELFSFDFLKIYEFEKYVTKNKLFFQKFDAFVSLTGLNNLKNFNDSNIKNINKHINVNYFPNILIIKELLKNMKKKKWGRILFTSSIGSKFGGSENSYAYSLSKFMNEFFPSHYKNYFKYNILINTLKIGLTNTKLAKKR
jgi:Dehydrogenases with different specificities (related to short-chain alcohol dehydrogenases)